PAPSIDIAYSGRLLRVAGSAFITIDSFVHVSASFAFEKGDDLGVTLENGASGMVSVLKIGASAGTAFFGVNGPSPANPGALGLSISGVEVAIALMTPTVGSSPAGTVKSLFALRATGSVALVGIDGLNLSMQRVTVEVNSATPLLAGGPAPAVNFTLLPGGGMDVRTGPDPDGDGPTAAPSVKLAFAGTLFQASGFITLTIGEFVHLSGTVAFQKGARFTAALTQGPGELVEAMKIGASNVNIFVGTGGPYFRDSNVDGIIDGSDTVQSAGAIGLVLRNVEFGLALLKPVNVASTRSWFALKARATQIALVGVPGLTLEATQLLVEINSGSDSAAAPNTAVPVVNWTNASMTAAMRAIPGTSLSLDYSAQLLRVFGRVTLGVAGFELEADVSFEQTTRAGGVRATKIALSSLSIDFAGIFTLSGLTGVILITPQGIAAEFDVPFSYSVGTDNPLTPEDERTLYIAATFSLAINNTNGPVNETFILTPPRDLDGNGTLETAAVTKTLTLQAGPYVRLSALGIVVTMKGFSVTGNFVIDQVTVGAEKLIRVAATNVSVTFGDPGVGSVSLTNGRGGFVFFQNGLAGVLSGDFAANLGPVDLSVEPRLLINTRPAGAANNVNQTIAVGNETVVVNVAADTFQIELRNASISFGDVLTLTGDFFSHSDANRTIWGATNVEIFLGAGPYRIDGEINPDAVGVLVTDATVGVVKFAGAGSDQFALYAFGRAALVGLDGLTVTGTLRVQINKTGRAVDELVTLNPDQRDNDFDGLIDEADEETIRVRYTSAANKEVFEVGYDEQGLPVETSQLVIGAAGIFTIRGSVRFTKLPSQSIDVEIQRAAIAISVPIDGSLTEILELRGTARFSFGGSQGFQLQNFFVNGFSVFGQSVATLQSPATQLRAPSAEVATPLAGSRQDVALLNDATDRFIYVYFRDTNMSGFDVATITDDAAEFVLLGAAASGVTVNGRAIQVDPNNPNLFKYSYTGNFTTPNAASDPYNTVVVNFVPGSFRDVRGAVNVEETQTFNVFAAAGSPDFVPAPTLANPFNGTTINLRSFLTRPYIDVTFTPGANGIVEEASIDGNEIRLTGAAAVNFMLNANGTPVLAVGTTPQKLNATTWRYTLTPKTNFTYVAGALTVEIVSVVPSTSDVAWRIQKTDGTGAPLAGQFVNGSNGSGTFTLTAA
ncbi:MAG: hypothetical protein ACYC1P_13355, partial [Gaiellaceae bacterium]